MISKCKSKFFLHQCHRNHLRNLDLVINALYIETVLNKLNKPGQTDVVLKRLMSNSISGLKKIKDLNNNLKLVKADIAIVKNVNSIII